jgi:hypothetical protein
VERRAAERLVAGLDVLSARCDLLVGSMASDRFAKEFNPLDFGAHGLGYGLGEG